jgi:hypothetical protein
MHSLTNTVSLHLAPAQSGMAVLVGAPHATLIEPLPLCIDNEPGMQQSTRLINS